MGFSKTFNSTTMYGRRNVALATLVSIASYITYKKMAPTGPAKFAGMNLTAQCEEAAPPFPNIASTHSLVAKHVTPETVSYTHLRAHET